MFALLVNETGKDSRGFDSIFHYILEAHAGKSSISSVVFESKSF